MITNSSFEPSSVNFNTTVLNFNDSVHYYNGSSGNYDIVAIDTAANGTNNSSAYINSTLVPIPADGVGENSGKICENWLDAQHVLFQLANLCLAISFLTPSSFKYHCLFLRSLLLLGVSLFIFWSGLVVCMLDVLGWNVAFFIINICHITHLAYSTYPVKFHSQLEELYVKLFKPLKMTRFEFKSWTGLGKQMNLAKGNIYAIEGVTNCGEKFSILLRGSLKVTLDRMFLHHIESNQFVDSPEYESMVQESLTDAKYQVTISAAEDSCLLVWPMDTLDEFLQTNDYFSTVLHNLVGKDITHKMYQIQEMLMSRGPDGGSSCPDQTPVLPNCPSSMINIRSSMVLSPSEKSLEELNNLDDDGRGIHFTVAPFSSSHQSSLRTLPSSHTYETSV